MLVFFGSQISRGSVAPTPQIKIAPTAADVAYGDDAAQKFDVYLPTVGKGPFPFMFFIHGGGWQNNDKRDVIPAFDQLLAGGCAVVSTNYRFLRAVAAAPIVPPVAGVLADNRRALQFVRLHAANWNLNPDKIVVSGGSAGACSALYLGAEGEQADPSSPDPVERISTRVLAVCPVAAQTTLDPARMREWVPGVDWGDDAFGYGGAGAFEKFLAEREKWLPSISKYSPDYLLTKNAPPIYFVYYQGLSVPGSIPPHSPLLVHSPQWAIGYQMLARRLGVPCYLEYPGHPSEKYGDEADFCLHQVGLR